MKCIWTLIIFLGVEAAAFTSSLSIKTTSIHTSTQYIEIKRNQENRHKQSFHLNQSHLKKRRDDRIPPFNSDSTHLQMSPSGIDELPIIYQSSIFLGIYTMLSISTIQSIKLIDSLSKGIGLETWRNVFVDKLLPLLLGILYTTAGIGHFTNSVAFCSIYPPVGTWGIWYLFGSVDFHVAWTGVVEILGGSGLLVGSVRSLWNMEDDDDGLVLKLMKPASAVMLFILTVLVTPANIYMYTHGAVMGVDMPPLDVSFHYIRFVIQVLLLSTLFVLAKDGLFFAWGDELD